MERYWHHAESESVGVFDEEHLAQWEQGIGEPVEEIDQEQYLKLHRLYAGDDRTDHNNFYNNLEFAQRGEEEVATLLEKRLKGFKLKAFNEDKDYDIVGDFNGKEVTIEVKEDVRVLDTGNVVVETRSRGKPSGLATTNAKFWVFRLHLKSGIEHYLIKPEKLKNRIKAGGIRSRQMTHTDSCNKLWFFKVEQIIELADWKL